MSQTRRRMDYDELGRELPDRTPVARPVGWKQPASLREQIRKFVRDELSRVAEEQGAETFEEADDFDIEDDAPDPSSPYELDEGLPRWDDKSERQKAIQAAEEHFALKTAEAPPGPTGAP